MKEASKKDSRVRASLAWLTVIAFLSALIILMLTGKTLNNEVILIMIGALVACFKDVYGFYFGSSSGSKQKEEVLSERALSNEVPQGGGEKAAPTPAGQPEPPAEER